MQKATICCCFIIWVNFLICCTSEEQSIKNNSEKKPLKEENQSEKEDEFEELESEDLGPGYIPKNEGKDKKFNFNNFSKLFSEGLRLNKFSNKNTLIIPFLGATGSGKSTTIAYLLGMSMKSGTKKQLNIKIIEPNTDNINLDEDSESESYEDDSQYIIVDKSQFIDKSDIPKIGHTVKSETLYPKLYFDNKNDKYAFCDCPGFFDNRGQEEEASVALCTRNIFMSSIGIKALCFLITWSDLEASRSEIFRKIANILFRMIEAPELHAKSIFLIFTKPPSPKQTIKKYISKIKLLKDQYRNSKKYEEKIQFDIANMFLKHKKTNMFLINPLDRGESKKLIINALNNSEVIPKKDFKFIGGEHIKDEIMNVFLKKIKESTPLIRAKQKSPIMIKKLNEEIKRQIKIKDENQKLIDKIKENLKNEKNKDLFDYNKSLIILNETLKRSNINKENQIQKNKKEIKSKENQIHWQNTHDHYKEFEMEYEERKGLTWSRYINKYIYKNLGEPISDIYVWKRNGKFFENKTDRDKGIIDWRYRGAFYYKGAFHIILYVYYKDKYKWDIQSARNTIYNNKKNIITLEDQIINNKKTIKNNLECINDIKKAEGPVKDNIVRTKNQLKKLKYNLKRYLLCYQESSKKLPLISSDLNILYEANKYLGIDNHNINNFIEEYYIPYYKDPKFIDYSDQVKQLKEIKIKLEDLNIFANILENDKKNKKENDNILEDNLIDNEIITKKFEEEEQEEEKSDHDNSNDKEILDNEGQNQNNENNLDTYQDEGN